MIDRNLRNTSLSVTKRKLVRLFSQIMLISLMAVAPAAAKEADVSLGGESTATTNIPARFADFDYSVREMLLQRNLPSISIVLAKDGEIVFDRAYGYADRDGERQIPASTSTPYLLASVSKPFTTVALMTLVEDGKINLDRPVNDYLGSAKITAHVGDQADITLRRIANHTAGLPLHYDFFYTDEARERPPMDDIIRLFGKSTAKPGTRFNYANFGYGVLDYVIERTSGDSFGQYLDDAIFTPLDMENSGVLFSDSDRDDLAVLYGPDGAPVPPYDTSHRGASNVYASAQDLARFGMFLSGSGDAQMPKLLKPESLAALVDVQPAVTEDDQSTYGLGVNVRRDKGRLIYSHSGSMAGVASTMTLYPEDGAVVVVLINSSAFGASKAVSEIRDLAIEILAPKPLAAPDPQVLAGLRTLGGEWSGSIQLPEGKMPLTLSVGMQGIHASLNGGPSAVGTPVGATDGLYQLAFRDIRLPTKEAARYPHGLLLAIEAVNGKLSGSATAYGATDANRINSALSFWTQLSRKETAGKTK